MDAFPNSEDAPQLLGGACAIPLSRPVRCPGRALAGRGVHECQRRAGAPGRGRPSGAAGHHVPGPALSQKQGSLAAAQPLAVSVNLKLRNTGALDRFVTAVSTPGDPQFGRYLTPDQFMAAYGPTQDDVDRVTGFLTSQGMTVTGVSANRQVVNASGSADRIARAFGTHESMYMDAAQNRTFYANDSAASVPSALAGVVGGDHRSGRPHQPHHPNSQAGCLDPGRHPQRLRPGPVRRRLQPGKLGANGTGATVALWSSMATARPI